MNIVCLSTCRDSPGYVARRVAESFPTSRIIQVVSSPRKSPLRRRLASALKGAWLRHLEYQWHYRAYFDRGSRKLEESLDSSAPAPRLSTISKIPSSQINAQSTVALLGSLRPDVLLVVGAPILKPHIFEIPRLAAINVHFGVSPYYRGEHTLFWPMYYRDYSNVGVTIHLIDKGIDTGRILAQGFVSVTADDDEWTLEAKAAQMASDLTIDVLRVGRFEPRWQPAAGIRGRMFNFNGRRLWHDAWYATRRRWLAERPFTTEARAMNYCHEPFGGEQVPLDDDGTVVPRHEPAGATA